VLPDPLRLAIALIPLAAYSLLLALVNARRRPFVTTGGSDLAALGAAVSGLILVGPIELFRPEAASAEFGGYVWLFLLVFYWLWVWLAVLVIRPRLVVYNISAEELRPVIAEAARRVDPQARWAGDSLSMPTLGIALHLEAFEIMRNAALVSSGGKQNIAGWKKLSAEVRNQLATIRVSPNPRSLGFTLLAIGLVTASIIHMVNRPEEVAQAVQEMMSF
jgi:hypothetical protein